MTNADLISNLDLGDDDDSVIAPLTAAPATAAPTSATPAPAPVATAPATAAPARVKIVLEDNELIPPTGLFIGVNGRSYLLKSGVEVAVPQGVIDALDNAIITVPVIEAATQRNIGWRDRKRYPYRRV